jgi:hypothetical protein
VFDDDEHTESAQFDAASALSQEFA